MWNACKWKVRLCLRKMCFLLLFCRQDVSRSPSILLLTPSFNLFGSADGCWSLQWRGKKVNTRPHCSTDDQQLHLPWPLHSQGLKDEQVNNEWAEVPVLEFRLHRPLSSLFSPVAQPSPPSLCYGRSNHIWLKVYTLSSANPIP